MPSVIIASSGSIIASESFGNHTYDKNSPLTTNESIYDIASLTKVISLSPVIMKLVAMKKIGLKHTLDQFYNQIDEDKKHLELTNGRLEKLHKLSENEILFEAANTLRLGKDLLYLQSSSGNAKASKWLKSVVGHDYNVHVTDSIYRSSHIDSTLIA